MQNSKDFEAVKRKVNPKTHNNNQVNSNNSTYKSPFSPNNPIPSNNTPLNPNTSPNSPLYSNPRQSSSTKLSTKPSSPNTISKTSS